MATKKRYIDANDALERLQKAEREMKVVSIVGCKAVPIEGVIEFIQSRPTVDAVEVVHGQWKLSRENEISKTVWCTACGEGFYIRKKGELQIDKMHYCPNCGADMREVGDQ